MKNNETQQSQQTVLRIKFKLYHACVKFVAMILMVFSQYLHLNFPICLSEGDMEYLYPYAAFAGTLLLGVIYIASLSGIARCGISSWIVVDVIFSFILLTSMVWVCNLTLNNCDRPLKSIYFLPETLGILASGLVMLHALFWLYRFHPILSREQV